MINVAKNGNIVAGGKMRELVFTEDRVLPVGDYEMTIDSIRDSILVIGDGGSESWDITWRSLLVGNM